MLPPPTSPCPAGFFFWFKDASALAQSGAVQLEAVGWTEVLYLPAVHNKAKGWVQFAGGSSLGPKNSAWELL